MLWSSDASITLEVAAPSTTLRGVNEGGLINCNIKVQTKSLMRQPKGITNFVHHICRFKDFNLEDCDTITTNTFQF